MTHRIRRPRLPRAPKARGELAEARFIAKVISLGFWIAQPFGDNLPFDFIVGAGRNRWRVQVKSAWYKGGSKYVCYQFNTRRGTQGHAQRPYTRRDFDFLIGYVGPEDLWLVIPVRVLRGRVMVPFTLGRRCELGRYREAWHLLTRTPTRAARTSRRARKFREV